MLFLLCFIFYLKAISKYKHPKEVTPMGKLTEGFLCYEFEGLIHGRTYFQNFTVVFAGPYHG